MVGHRVLRGVWRVRLEGFLSTAAARYRVIYRIHDADVIVEVVKISHRADVYN